MSHRLISFAAAAFTVRGAATGAVAQPKLNQPASLLVFPLFESGRGTATVINVTNTNMDRSVCPLNDNFRVGDVRLHYVYYGARHADLDGGGRTPWLEFDRLEDLTPGDSLSVLPSEQNPDADVGFLTVKALAPDTEEAIDFDYLIGSAYIADAQRDVLWCYVP